MARGETWIPEALWCDVRIHVGLAGKRRQCLDWERLLAGAIPVHCFSLDSHSFRGTVTCFAGRSLFRGTVTFFRGTVTFFAGRSLFCGTVTFFAGRSLFSRDGHFFAGRSLFCGPVKLAVVAIELRPVPLGNLNCGRRGRSLCGDGHFVGHTLGASTTNSVGRSLFLDGHCPARLPPFATLVPLLPLSRMRQVLRQT